MVNASVSVYNIRSYPSNDSSGAMNDSLIRSGAGGYSTEQLVRSSVQFVVGTAPGLKG